MVEVFTDKALSLDNLLSYGPMHSAFEEFMKQEKSMGKIICRRIVDQPLLVDTQDVPLVFSH